jgi:hypothetical protein
LQTGRSFWGTTGWFVTVLNSMVLVEKNMVFGD